MRDRGNPRSASRGPSRWLALAALPLVATAATGQRDKRPPKAPIEATWREDPYTENRASAIEAAGYVLLDRITWTDQYGSDRVEQALGDVKIRWIETPHFRLGVDLPKWKVPAHPKDVRNRIRSELAELAERMPKVKPKAKELDPWLRAHVYALRLEKLYADFLELVGKTDDAFPKHGESHPPGAEAFGRGPFLGTKSKFQVLLLSKEADCRRFLTTFTGADGAGPSRWYLAEPDAFVFATAIKFTDGAYEDDTALYCHVAFNLIHNLVDAYRGYYYRPTAWWAEGYAHCVRRAISDEFNMFSEVADRSERIYRWHDWERRVSDLLEHDLARPMADLAVRFDLEGMKFFDHLGMWSRVDFLLDQDRVAFGRFVTAVKGCVTTQGTAAPNEYQLQVQERALREHFDLDLATFDDAWKAWAKKAYKGK